MSDPVIDVENVSKRYFVGRQFPGRKHSSTLRDVFVREARGYGQRALRAMRGQQVVQGDQVEEFWALKNISFKINRGEVVGIIGRNGAGKSTLLKIISRITAPTEGRLSLRGRVASLLEVGTGFHQELTGRENIFLNGAILGMRRQEIIRKFDEIVAFAEIEKFIDTPVKRYSSGMYVRLAFSVAAHLEPEILIVDEVLAVGDSEFQKKCLGRMDVISRREGRTVLFVSHNMQTISVLCGRAFLLENGRMSASGSVDDVLKAYHARTGMSEEFRVRTPLLRWCGLQNRHELDGLRNDQDIVFKMLFESGPEPIRNLHVDCDLIDERDRTAVHCRSKFVRDSIAVPANTRFIIRYVLRSPRLAPGHYQLIVYAANRSEELCWVEHIDACRISSASPFAASAILDGVKGTTVPDFTVENISES